ncbi:MAG: TolC family protein [Oscillospiraceae bacterium]|nr:TolC family protein [Oscillospiraceae bacterium]
MNIKYIIASILIFLSVQVNAINLSVSECREMALRNDEDIKIAQNRVRQSDLDRGIAKSAYLPKFDIIKCRPENINVCLFFT